MSAIEDLNEKEDLQDVVDVELDASNAAAVAVNTEGKTSSIAKQFIDASKPVRVIYCPHCSLPCEYCKFGNIYTTKCLPWIQENCPEVLDTERVTKMLAGVSLADGEAEEKKKTREVIVPKKKAAAEVKVVLQLKQGQKRKWLTHITGLETIPDLKIKDAARVFGKKFSSGTSVGETPTGSKEVVIQGDVMFQLPEVLMKEFKIPDSAIFIEEGGKIKPYA